MKEFDSFRLVCPHCKAKASLYVVNGSFFCFAELTKSGFDITDGPFCHTSDEEVQCVECKHIFPLRDVTL